MRAVVLEGGGGKGAYQIGVLLALRSGGVKFDLVAGSSIGALNGFLLLTGQLSQGFQYWWNLRPAKVFRMRITSLLFLLAAPAYWMGRCIADTGGFQQAKPMAGVSWALGFGLLPIIATLLTWRIDDRHGELGKLGMVVLFSAISLIISTPYIIRYFALSLFGAEPLRDLIRRIDTDHAMTIPLIVTVSELVDAFDPDYPEFRAAGHGAVLPMPKPRYFPVYFDLRKISPDDRIRILLASAALPHGILPAIRLREADYEDGGLADNLPIYAVLQTASVNEMMVVRLRPSRRRDLIRAWQRADRFCRLRQMPFELQKEKGEWRFLDPVFKRVAHHKIVPRVIPLRIPRNWPEIVKEIAPAASLGGLFSGTLNLSRAKARRLLAQGWCDGRFALNNPSAIPLKLPVDEFLKEDNT